LSSNLWRQKCIEALGVLDYDNNMEAYKEKLAQVLAETGALFFAPGLVLKDGRTTPYFVNMAMFKTGRLSLMLGSFFAGMMMERGLADNTDIILGPSYKGSAIALATAISVWQEYGRDMFFEYDRKETKTHGEGSVSGSMFVNRAFFDGCRVFVVDDVATSMGTKYDLIEKVEQQARTMHIHCRIMGIGIGVDREQVTAVYDKDGKVIPGKRGKDAVQDFVDKSGVPVYAVAGIRELVEFLYRKKVPVLVNGHRRPIDEETKAAFDAYLETYGVSR
jgi:orotate phosphoribosyltransferase